MVWTCPKIAVDLLDNVDRSVEKPVDAAVVAAVVAAAASEIDSVRTYHDTR